MASINNKLTNLTDIPLKLEQGDGIDVNAKKTEKGKSNSLKRLFRSARSSMTSSKFSASDDVVDAECESEMKNVRSLQLRFGSFHKNDDNEEDKLNTGPSSSVGVLESKTKEPRSKLQQRIAGYWAIASKKFLKKPLTNDDVKVKNTTNPPLNDIDEIENNQSDNL